MSFQDPELPMTKVKNSDWLLTEDHSDFIRSIAENLYALTTLLCIRVLMLASTDWAVLWTWAWLVPTVAGG